MWIVKGLTHSLEEYANSRRLSSLGTDSMTQWLIALATCLFSSLSMGSQQFSTLLNGYGNRVNCRWLGCASLIRTNFSFEQQDDQCPNRSTTPLPMWYIVSPPSPGLSIDSQQSEPLPPWRGMQLSPTPHHCSFRVLLSHTVGEESESIKGWKWKWWASSLTRNATAPTQGFANCKSGASADLIWCCLRAPFHLSNI